MGDDRLFRAICMAFDAHEGQHDKGGSAYVLHPLRVMLKCKSEDARIAAVLHDVVEDTDITVEDIKVVFGLPVARAVGCLTRMRHESYDDFIHRVSCDDIAREVKMADLADNMDLDRLNRPPTDADMRRVEKYRRSLARLKGE